MNVKRGDYIMWFTRYGSTEARVMYHLDDCYELAAMLEDAETCVFDQYGCLIDVEKVGDGPIPEDEWDRGLEDFQARQAREYEALRESVKDEPKPIGAVSVCPPSEHERRFGVEHFASAYSVEDLESKRTLAAELFGDHRVSVRMYRTNN